MFNCLIVGVIFSEDRPGLEEKYISRFIAFAVFQLLAAERLRHSGRFNKTKPSVPTQNPQLIAGLTGEYKPGAVSFP